MRLSLYVDTKTGRWTLLRKRGNMVRVDVLRGVPHDQPKLARVKADTLIGFTPRWHFAGGPTIELGGARIKAVRYRATTDDTTNERKQGR